MPIYQRISLEIKPLNTTHSENPRRLTCGHVLLLIVGFMSVGCNLLFVSPKEATREQRMAAFPEGELPVKRPVQIYWNEHSVPFIEAKTDEDAAFALGLVHAHLRLGMMEAMVRIARGEISSMAGPFTIDIDHTLRILDIDKAVDQQWAKMPEDSKAWVENFTRGLNHYLQHAKDNDTLPLEYDLLNIEPKPWTTREVLTIGRLAGVDLSWIAYLQFLMLQTEPEASAPVAELRARALSRSKSKSEAAADAKAEDSLTTAWKAYLAAADSSTPSVELSKAQTTMLDLFRNFSRSGSNSLVIGKDLSQTGSALMANDPHLGIYAPNIWLLVGLKSPSYHMVGLSITGLPFIAVGRNSDIAWGGTNMRSLSSHLFELSEEQIQAAKVREERIEVRGRWGRSVEIRDSEFGPIMTDAPFLAGNSDTDKARAKPVLAINWTGHRPSDELTSFLRANRARDWASFEQAFSDYAVSGQNMTFADSLGGVGMVLAYKQPVLRQPSTTLDLIKSTDNPVVAYRTPADLPSVYRPESGYIASSNNRPFVTDIPIALNFASNARVERQQALVQDTLKQGKKIAISDLKQWHVDTYAQSSVDIQKGLIETCGAELQQLVRRSKAGQDDLLWSELQAWDGRYEVESRGAVAFEMLTAQLKDVLLQLRFPNKDEAKIFARDNYWQSSLKQEWSEHGCSRLQPKLNEVLADASARFKDVANWGEMHRLSFGHPLKGAPFVGDKFTRQNIPYPGSNDTLLKAAHPHSLEVSEVTYGANARHISDLSDIDANWFLLLGGQDGYLNNPQLDDQLALWLRGEYLQMPLRLSTVKALFKTKKTLVPSAKAQSVP